MGKNVPDKNPYLDTFHAMLENGDGVHSIFTLAIFDTAPPMTMRVLQFNL